MRDAFQDASARSWARDGKIGTIMGDMEQGQRSDSGIYSEGELRCGGQRVRLRGRALRLIIWLAGHQTRINETATESGQIWLTWKGDGPHSIEGDIRTRL